MKTITAYNAELTGYVQAADGIHAVGDPNPLTTEEMLELSAKERNRRLLDSIPETEIADYLTMKGWNVQ